MIERPLVYSGGQQSTGFCRERGTAEYLEDLLEMKYMGAADYLDHLSPSRSVRFHWNGGSFGNEAIWLGELALYLAA